MAERRTAERRTAERRTIASRIVASRTGGRQLALAIASLCLAFGCTKRNPDLCCETDAECTTIGFSSHAPCDLGVCVHNECTTAADTCDGDEDCNGATPACVAGTCSVCATSATCPAAAPVCDLMSHDCRACASDPECDSGACDLAAGTCVDQAEILYASTDGMETDACTKLAPCSLQRVAETVDATHDYIVLAAGSYTGGAVFDHKTVVVVGGGAIIDAENGPPIFVRIVNGSSVTARDLSLVDHLFQEDRDMPVIDIDATSGFIADRLRGSAHNTDSIRTNGKVTLKNCTFTDQAPVVFGQLTADRCTFLDGGPRIYGSATISNSIIIAGASGMGIQFDNTSQTPANSQIINNTFINGSISCDNSSTELRRFTGNILYHLTDLDSSSSCEYEYNLIQPIMSISFGQDNISGDPLFVDPTNNNFHLMAGSPAIDAADPTYLVNGHDFDGTPRPQGMHPDIGAFEYVPAAGQIDQLPRRAADHP
jgi:hypothetical protein